MFWFRICQDVRIEFTSFVCVVGYIRDEHSLLFIVVRNLLIELTEKHLFAQVRNEHYKKLIMGYFVSTNAATTYLYLILIFSRCQIRVTNV